MAGGNKERYIEHGRLCLQMCFYDAKDGSHVNQDVGALIKDMVELF